MANEPEGFAEFWLLWRKRQRKTDGRGKARPAYAQMIEAGHDPQDIIDGATWYLNNMSDKDAPYIPLAASWLRSERFLDDAEKKREAEAMAARRATNVRPIRAELPANHFSRQWEARKAGSGE